MFGKCDDVRFVVVGQVAECGNVFRVEHGTSIESADEEVCRVSHPQCHYKLVLLTVSLKACITHSVTISLSHSQCHYKLVSLTMSL